jgi:hypothetical protein
MTLTPLTSRGRPLLRSVVDTRRGSRRMQRAEREAQAGKAGAPRTPRGLFDPDLLRSALLPAVRKLDPRELFKNPVMFVVEVTATLVTLVWLYLEMLRLLAKLRSRD